VLQWARANGCEWSHVTSAAAAGSGHQHIVQWLHAGGCPWKANTCTAAARNGNLSLLIWALDNGCRHNPYMMVYRAKKYEHVQKWVQRNLLDMNV
jgi:hypothetical protein